MAKVTFERVSEMVDEDNALMDVMYATRPKGVL